jgi:hypothetical protein
MDHRRFIGKLYVLLHLQIIVDVVALSWATTVRKWALPALALHSEKEYGNTSCFTISGCRIPSGLYPALRTNQAARWDGV